MNRNRIVAVLAALAALTASIVAAPPALAAPFVCSGRCQDIVVPAPAGVSVTSGNVRLLLPQGYAGGTTRYPVIYLLCGAGGNQTEWTNSSDIANASAGAQAIFVMPDCGGAVGQPGWYSDWSSGAYKWETYYIRTLLPWIDAHYRTQPGRRGIAGLSMGGYGAMALAARNPGTFVTAASFSGLPETQYPGFSMVNAGIIPPGVWGNEKTNAAVWTAHNPRALAASLRGVSLYISCGSGDPSLYNGREEQISSIDSTAFVQALDAAGVPYHAGFYQGGAHTWPYFSMEAAWALPQMLADLSS